MFFFPFSLEIVSLINSSILELTDKFKMGITLGFLVHHAIPLLGHQKAEGNGEVEIDQGVLYSNVECRV